MVKIEDQQQEKQIPTFEGDDLFKAMWICVNAFGDKDLKNRTATLPISAKAIKDMADDIEMNISYNEEHDSFVFEIPIKIKRTRKIIRPGTKLILPPNMKR